MYFVGLDLAWGENKPTGVAVLDGRGHLVHIDAVRTDQEIGASIAAYVAGNCLVAIDAPLVVTNPTGNRPAERALNKDFARYDAGAHPSNTAKREFADVPRGARLSARLGLDIDPDSRGPRYKLRAQMRDTFARGKRVRVYYAKGRRGGKFRRLGRSSKVNSRGRFTRSFRLTSPGRYRVQYRFKGSSLVVKGKVTEGIRISRFGF